MINETNQSTNNVHIHDIVILDKLQRTNDDGTKRGYSFYSKEEIGVVTKVGENKLVLIKGDGSELIYIPSDIDKDYYYRISRL